MKKFFLIILFLKICFVNISSQEKQKFRVGFSASIINNQISKSGSIDDYNNFLSINSRWNYVSHGFEGYHASIYSITNDTIINGYLHYIINEEFVKIDNVNNDINANGFGTIQYLREDVSHKKIYRYISNNSEELLYDFNLKINDKLPANIDFTLNKIDTITLITDQRKRFIFKNNSNNEIIWIEGIGNIANPFISDALNDESQKLVCLLHAGNTIYSENYNNISCNSFKSLDINNIGINHLLVSIYPNPTQKYVRISINDDFNKINAIKIFNMDGKIITDINTLESKYIDLNFSTLPNGIYLCVINIGNRLMTYKVIKE